MPDHVEECNGAGPSLRRIHPVAGPRIFRNIAFAAIPDKETVKRVIQNRQPDTEQLQSHNEREAAQEFNLFAVRARPLSRKGVRKEVLDEKQADGNDAGQ